MPKSSSKGRQGDRKTVAWIEKAVGRGVSGDCYSVFSAASKGAFDTVTVTPNYTLLVQNKFFKRPGLVGPGERKVIESIKCASGTLKLFFVWTNYVRQPKICLNIGDTWLDVSATLSDALAGQMSDGQMIFSSPIMTFPKRKEKVNGTEANSTISESGEVAALQREDVA